MVTAPPVRRVDWRQAKRIIRSIYPPIDVFEDIADPADWDTLIALEQKTNPRLSASIGQLDRIAPERRVGGPGAIWLMAPFTHASPDRPTRFSNGRYGVLYVANRFETAVAETAHHHARFMAATAEPAGWASQFRELTLTVDAALHDLRVNAPPGVLDPDDYCASQSLAEALRKDGSDGVVYPSVRDAKGECAGLFHPDLARAPVQGRHLDYHWNGEQVDLIRDAGTHAVYRLSA